MIGYIQVLMSYFFKKGVSVQKITRESLVLGLLLLSFACSRTPVKNVDQGAAVEAVEENAEAQSVLPPDTNVILISIDTLRADHMSLYGYKRDTTPQLEAFAKEAVVFDSFVNNGGGTLPSHMSMMTSLHPQTHFILPESGNVLQPERVTLAESLKAKGLATAGFVDSGWLRGKFGFDQGFDRYDDYGGHFVKILPKANWWIDHNKEKPFFLFLHTYDVHSGQHKLPYECPEPDMHRYTAGFEDVKFDGCKNGICATELLKWVNQGVEAEKFKASSVFSKREIAYITALYDGGIHYVDGQLGKFFARLRELGLFDRSLIIITADHGEEFLEHGYLIHDQDGYEELAHIPLIIRFPGGKYGGRRIQYLAAMVDIMPTILKRVGGDIPDEAQGYDLMPTIVYGAPVRRDAHQFMSLRTERFKYFISPTQLYDLHSDPGETLNIQNGEPGLSRVLKKRLEDLLGKDDADHRAFVKKYGEASKFQLAPSEAEQLKALGYLQ